MLVTIKEELIEKDEEIKRQIAVIKELRNRVAELEGEEIGKLVRRLMATKCKNKDLEQQLAIYKRALELACFNIDCMYCSHFECRKEPYNEKHNRIECGELGLIQKRLSKYFLDLAKERLEKGEE